MNTNSIKALALGVLFASNVVVAGNGNAPELSDRETLTEVSNGIGATTDLMGAMYKTTFQKVKNGYKKAYNYALPKHDAQALFDGLADGSKKIEDLTARQRVLVANNAVGNVGYVATAKEYAKDAASFVSTQASNVATYAKANKGKTVAIVAATAAATAAVYVAYQKGVFGKIKAKAAEYKKTAVAAVSTATAAGVFGLGLYLNKVIAA